MKYGNYLLFIFTGLLCACHTRTGEFTTPGKPITKLFLSSINLPDSLGKSGIISLYWSGESRNGYLKGFEITSDTDACETAGPKLDLFKWTFTTKNDSAFLFTIPKGKSTARISFYARSVDNYDQVDPNPPCLRIPLRNSEPFIFLDKNYGGKAVTDTVHSVFSLSWQIFDADGYQNMDSVFVKINQGNWLGISKTLTQLTFVPNDPDATTYTTAKLLGGLDGIDLNLTTSPLKVGGRDTVYLRVKDISNAFSQLDTAFFFYKPKVSNILYVDAYEGDQDKNVIAPMLGSIFGNKYDVYDMYRSNGAYFPQNWNLTFTKYLTLFDKVIWIADITSPTGLSIENGAAAIQSLLNKNGKILASVTKMPSNRESPIYQFVPLDSLSKDVGQARLLNGVNFLPLNGFKDTLQTSGLLLNVGTLYANEANQLYKASSLLKLSGWNGPDIFAVSANDNNGKLNRVFFGLDLFRLNGRPDALRSFLENILVKEFDKQ